MVILILCPEFNESDGDSLLEQILEGLSRVVRTQAGGRGSFFFSGHANLVESALVPSVFLGNPLLDRLHALEPAARIKIRTLLARMQFKSALETLIARRGGQHRPALGAARDRARARQIHRSGTERVVFLRRRCPGFFSCSTARFSVAVLITMLTVFGCHKTLPAAWLVLSPPEAGTASLPLSSRFLLGTRVLGTRRCDLQ